MRRIADDDRPRRKGPARKCRSRASPPFSAVPANEPRQGRVFPEFNPGCRAAPLGVPRKRRRGPRDVDPDEIERRFRTESSRRPVARVDRGGRIGAPEALQELIAVVGVEDWNVPPILRQRGVQVMREQPMPMQNRHVLGLAGLGMPAEEVVVFRAGLARAVMVSDDVEVNLGQGNAEQSRDHQRERQPPRHNRHGSTIHDLAPHSNPLKDSRASAAYGIMEAPNNPVKPIDRRSASRRIRRRGPSASARPFPLESYTWSRRSLQTSWQISKIRRLVRALCSSPTSTAP